MFDSAKQLRILEGVLKFAEVAWVRSEGQFVFPDAESFLGVQGRRTSFFDLVHPRDRNQAEIDWQIYCGSDRSIFDHEYELKVRGPEATYVRIRSVPDPDNEDLVFLVWVDISGRKLLEKQLYETSERLQLALDASLAGIWDYDVERDEVFVDHKWLEIFGRNPMDEVSTELEFWYSHIDPLERSSFEAAMQDFVNGEIVEFKRQYRGVRKDGVTLWIQTEAAISHNVDGTPKRVVGWSRDISGEIELRERLRQQEMKLFESSKLSAIGSMAGGVAHEINNPLMILDGYLMRLRRALVKLGLDDQGEINEILDKLDRASSRMSRLTENLRMLTVSGLGDEPNRIRLGEVVSDVREFFEERFKEAGVRLDIGDADSTLQLVTSRSDLTRILYQLVSNAFEALQTAEKKDRWIRVRHEVQNQKILIRVEDGGGGVPPHLVGRIFEPFFSTKESVYGVGLGLSQAQQLAESRGGRIFLENRKDPTCFTLELPKLVPNPAQTP